MLRRFVHTKICLFGWNICIPKSMLVASYSRHKSIRKCPSILTAAPQRTCPNGLRSNRRFRAERQLRRRRRHHQRSIAVRQCGGQQMAAGSMIITRRFWRRNKVRQTAAATDDGLSSALGGNGGRHFGHTNMRIGLGWRCVSENLVGKVLCCLCVDRRYIGRRHFVMAQRGLATDWVG